jgi:hypothetical protein
MLLLALAALLLVTVDGTLPLIKFTFMTLASVVLRGMLDGRDSASGGEDDGESVGLATTKSFAGEIVGVI